MLKNHLQCLLEKHLTSDYLKNAFRENTSTKNNVRHTLIKSP